MPHNQHMNQCIVLSRAGVSVQWSYQVHPVVHMPNPILDRLRHLLRVYHRCHPLLLPPPSSSDCCLAPKRRYDVGPQWTWLSMVPLDVSAALTYDTEPPQRVVDDLDVHAAVAAAGRRLRHCHQILRYSIAIQGKKTMNYLSSLHPPGTSPTFYASYTVDCIQRISCLVDFPSGHLVAFC